MPRRDVAALVVRMAVEHPQWGDTRIRGALSNLGHEIARTTVKRTRHDHGIDPAPERSRRLPGKTFLQAPWEGRTACDLFTVEVLTLAGLQRYLVFFVTALQSRRVTIAGIPPQPYGAWMEQMARNLTDPVDGCLRRARYLMHDRDPGGLRSVVAESVLVKQQLLILNRSRHRAPNLCASDRILAGVCALFMRSARVIRSAIVLRPSTILEFHRALRTRKYRWLFSPKRRRTGPQGPSKALVDAIVDMKRRNPRWGCPRIAQQIALAFAVDIDKDVVRRVLATHYRPAPHSGGPSWLTFLGHAKDSLWSIDLFRCESATLRSHWVLVVMDQYTRRIVGFGRCRIRLSNG